MRTSTVVTVFISAISCTVMDVVRYCHDSFIIRHCHNRRCCYVVGLFFVVMWLWICLMLAFYVIHLQMIWHKRILMLMCRLGKWSCSFHAFPCVTISIVTGIVAHCCQWHWWWYWWARRCANWRRLLGSSSHSFSFVRVFHFYKLSCLPKKKKKTQIDSFFNITCQGTQSSCTADIQNNWTLDPLNKRFSNLSGLFWCQILFKQLHSPNKINSRQTLFTELILPRFAKLEALPTKDV